MTCDRCPLSLLCLGGEILLTYGHYCTKCGRFNLNLDGTKRQVFSCRLDTQRARIRVPASHWRFAYCLHCTMSQVVFFDHDLARQVIYERRKKGARLKLKDFVTGKVIRAQERPP